MILDQLHHSRARFHPLAERLAKRKYLRYLIYSDTQLYPEGI